MTMMGRDDKTNGHYNPCRDDLNPIGGRNLIIVHRGYKDVFFKQVGKNVPIKKNKFGVD